MKKVLIIFSLLIAFQFHAQSTKQKATIYFKDGKVLKCFARISGLNIRYSKKKFKSKEIKANYKTIDHIHLRSGDRLIKLYYKLEKGKKKPRLMELIVEGKVKLYRVADVYGGTFSNGGMRVNSNYVSSKTANTRYYLETNDGDGTVFRIKKHFEAEAKKYFKDCEKLTKKIGTSGFRKKDLLNIVLFYNDECEE